MPLPCRTPQPPSKKPPDRGSELYHRLATQPRALLLDITAKDTATTARLHGPRAVSPHQWLCSRGTYRQTLHLPSTTQTNFSHHTTFLACFPSQPDVIMMSPQMR